MQKTRPSSSSKTQNPYLTQKRRIHTQGIQDLFKKLSPTSKDLSINLTQTAKIPALPTIHILQIPQSKVSEDTYQKNSTGSKTTDDFKEKRLRQCLHTATFIKRKGGKTYQTDSMYYKYHVLHIRRDQVFFSSSCFNQVFFSQYKF